MGLQGVIKGGSKGWVCKGTRQGYTTASAQRVGSACPVPTVLPAPAQHPLLLRSCDTYCGWPSGRPPEGQPALTAAERTARRALTAAAQRLPAGVEPQPCVSERAVLWECQVWARACGRRRCEGAWPEARHM
eukprot:356008-Chlamydomonas_euryale.AAC.2